MGDETPKRKFKWQTGISSFLLLILAIAIWLAHNEQRHRNALLKRELFRIVQIQEEVQTLIETAKTSRSKN